MSNPIMQKEIKSDASNILVVKEDFKFFEEFKSVEQIYSAGIKEIKTKLEILDDEFHIRYAHNPIHHMEWRLKSPHSIFDKLERKNLPLNLDSITDHIYDIAGIRVICNYVKDIYRIADLLTSQDDITLIRTKDYIKHPKENGYRSLHLVVEVPVFLAQETQMVPVEIQIRTIAMDFWASLEHQIRYKNEEEVPSDIRKRLLECAESITELDQEMQDIHNKIKGKQNLELK